MARRPIKTDVPKLERSIYLERDDSKLITKIYCKICGAVIAEKLGGEFRYRSNYAEAKFRFEDGSMHVTNLCKRCLPRLGNNPALMTLMHSADIEDLAITIPQIRRQLLRKKPKLIATVIGTRGLP